MSCSRSSQTDAAELKSLSQVMGDRTDAVAGGMNVGGHRYEVSLGPCGRPDSISLCCLADQAGRLKSREGSACMGGETSD